MGPGWVHQQFPFRRIVLEEVRRMPESNRLTQLCRLVHCHFATPP
ncbi:hypothetical protein BN2497_6767 [Janthinobacterium sp. CG23_2]|nr:hypothetical protein BN2497_6767 [Janthinobacterium sp. CG23_2]CUU29781.1 hypothetical protein BN3177_6767 [Janthinobacterium sp. CG23_2]